MLPDEIVTLDCPNCHAPITRPLAWFKQPYGTCPDCGGGISAGQFARVVADLEAALDESIEAMFKGESGCGCGGGGCGGH